MTGPLLATKVKQAICELHQAALAKLGYSLDLVPDELDLLQEGIIDSLGVLDLIGYLEERFKVSIDLEQLPAEQLTVLGPLSEHVAGFATNSATATESSSGSKK